MPRGGPSRGVTFLSVQLKASSPPQTCCPDLWGGGGLLSPRGTELSHLHCSQRVSGRHLGLVEAAAANRGLLLQEPCLHLRHINTNQSKQLAEASSHSELEEKTKMEKVIINIIPRGHPPWARGPRFWSFYPSASQPS